MSELTDKTPVYHLCKNCRMDYPENEVVLKGSIHFCKSCAKSMDLYNEPRKFETGAIRDSEAEKEDYIETISWSAFRRYAQYMTGKKSKYGAGNFKKGIPIESYERSLSRHLSKYFINKYEGGDLEVEEDHLAAIVFNCFGIMHEEERIKKTK